MMRVLFFVAIFLVGLPAFASQNCTMEYVGTEAEVNQPNEPRVDVPFGVFGMGTTIRENEEFGDTNTFILFSADPKRTEEQIFKPAVNAFRLTCSVEP